MKKDISITNEPNLKNSISKFKLGFPLSNYSKMTFKSHFVSLLGSVKSPNFFLGHPVLVYHTSFLVHSINSEDIKLIFRFTQPSHKHGVLNRMPHLPILVFALVATIKQRLCIVLGLAEKNATWKVYKSKCNSSSITKGNFLVLQILSAMH